MSLRQQFSLLVSLLITLLLVGSLALSVRNARHAFEQQLNARAYDAASALSLAMSQAAGDETLQLRFIDALYDRGFFSHIEFEPLQGQALYRRNEPTLVSNGPERLLANWLPLESLTAQNDVMQGWQRLGTVSVTSDANFAYQELWKLIRTELIWYSLVLFFSLAILQWLLRWLLKPLAAVEQQAKAICENQWPIQETLPRSRELKQMVQAMNQMVHKLRTLFSEQSALTEKLRLEAFIDGQTALLNRRGFDQRLESVLKSSDEHSGVLLLLQLSQLTQYNQQFGRQAADELIAGLGRHLNQWLRGQPQGFAGRRSGTDFALYLPCFGRTQALSLAQQLHDELATSVLSQRNLLSFHLGAVLLQQQDDQLSVALSCADAALRQAQHQGNAQPFLYQSESKQPEPSAGQWRAHLMNVLHYEALHLIFHPSFDQAGKQVQTEVLSRIEFDGQNIRAGRFWPMVEQHHLSVQFDALIVRKVLEYLPQAASAGQRWCINLSPASVLDPTFGRQLQKWLSAAPEAAAQLAFEVSESALPSIESKLLDLISLLAPHSLHWGVDQVGTGSLAFSYLRRLPLRYVRIDGSVSRGVAQAQDQRFFVQSMVPIASSLGIEVFADGVECQEDVEALKQAGVSALSGYYFLSQNG